MPPSPTKIPPLTIDGMTPAFVDKKTASAYLQSSKLVERMLWATRHTDDKWVEFALNAEGDPKQKTLITTTSVERAAERIVRGERPPKIGKLSMLIADSFVGDLVDGEVSHAFSEGFDPDLEEEKMEARKFQEKQAKQEAEALKEERQKAREGGEKLVSGDGEEPPEIEICVDL